MTAVPAVLTVGAVFQDVRAFKSDVKLNLAYLPDISSDTGLGTFPLTSIYAAVAGILTALAAMSNSKVVEQSIGIRFNLAQEPTTETGTYQLVQQHADFSFADGTMLRQRLAIPAPKDALFLTTSQDDLVVINPASSLLTALQSSITATVSVPAVTGGTLAVFTGQTRGGGTWGSQFFGGQMVQGKARRRRVLQGQ